MFSEIWAIPTDEDIPNHGSRQAYNKAVEEVGLDALVSNRVVIISESRPGKLTEDFMVVAPI